MCPHVSIICAEYVPFDDSSAATSQQDYSTCPVASGLLQRRAGRSSSFHAGTVPASHLLNSVQQHHTLAR